MKLLGWLVWAWKWIGRNKIIVVSVALLAVLFWALWVYWDGVLSCWEWFAEVPDGKESRSTTARNVGLLLFGVVAIAFAVWRGVVASRQAKTSHRGLLNERYQKGAEMLGSDVLAVRLAGIYALQRLAEENAEQYHIQIMRLLCAFVRHPTGDKNRDEYNKATGNKATGTERQPDNKDYPVREDVHAAMKAIGARSNVGIELEQEADFYLDLSGAHLNGAHLSGAHMNGAHLSGAYLNGAHLNDAHLNGANLNGARLIDADLYCAGLNGAHMNGANLSSAHLNDALLDDAHLNGAGLNFTHLNDALLLNAHLNDAHLLGAHLNDANLSRAHLNGADLSSAHLNNANLSGVDLTDADLRGSDLTAAKLSKAKGLTQQQLDRAVAVSTSPPELGSLRDAKTGDLLKWRGKEPDVDR